jgi:hypothetical protein
MYRHTNLLREKTSGCEIYVVVVVAEAMAMQK